MKKLLVLFDLSVDVFDPFCHLWCLVINPEVEIIKTECYFLLLGFLIGFFFPLFCKFSLPNLSFFSKLQFNLLLSNEPALLFCKDPCGRITSKYVLKWYEKGEVSCLYIWPKPKIVLHVLCKASSDWVNTLHPPGILSVEYQTWNFVSFTCAWILIIQV